MQQKAIFLDRDGTINVEKNYLYKIEDFEFLPGVIDGLKKLQDNGFLLVVVTNQSGIARGYYTEEDLKKLNEWMISTLEQSGIHISAIYYCPHHPEALNEKYRKKCDCRKPEIGLFLKAARDLDIDISKSYAIGDKIRDLQICSSSMIDNPAKGYLLYSDSFHEGNIKGIPGGINEAVDEIIEESKNEGLDS